MYQTINTANVTMVYAIEAYADTPLNDTIAMEGFHLPAKLVAGFRVLVKIIKKCMKTILEKILHPLQALRKVMKRDIQVAKPIVDFLRNDYPKIGQAYPMLMAQVSKLVALVERGGNADDFDMHDIYNTGSSMDQIRKAIREIDIQDKSKGTAAFRIADLDRIMSDCKKMYAKSNQLFNCVYSACNANESGVNPYKNISADELDKKDFVLANISRSISFLGEDISSTCICTYELCQKIFSAAKISRDTGPIDTKSNYLVRTAASINKHDIRREEDSAARNAKTDVFIDAAAKQMDEINNTFVSNRSRV